jgi:hypothetical protein
MGKKSDRRIFRKRRQRAGFALLVSLAVVVVGAIMFSSLKPFGNLSNLSAQGPAQGGGAEAVQRVDAPSVDRAPEEVAETDTQARPVGGPTDEELAAQDEEAAEQKRAAEEEKAQAESSGGGDEGEKAQKEPEQASGPPPIPQPATNDLWMDIPALGLNDNYIANS